MLSKYYFFIFFMKNRIFIQREKIFLNLPKERNLAHIQNKNTPQKKLRCVLLAKLLILHIIQFIFYFFCFCVVTKFLV